MTTVRLTVAQALLQAELLNQEGAGAVTLALPQDVQAEAHDWPEELFTERVWFIPRPQPEPSALSRAVDVLRSAQSWWDVPVPETSALESTQRARAAYEAARRAQKLYL